jgi:hypothetical protein
MLPLEFRESNQYFPHFQRVPSAASAAVALRGGYCHGASQSRLHQSAADRLIDAPSVIAHTTVDDLSAATRRLGFGPSQPQ